MTNSNTSCDCTIIGGGIAGLTLSIQLAQLGYKVIVIEKHTYPFHKVCGEYVSNESRDFLIRIGLPLNDWELPEINQLGISSAKGFLLETALSQGGFGISRYRLDNELLLLAKKNGVIIYENCKAISTSTNVVSTTHGTVLKRLIVGAFGKATPVFAKSNVTKRTANYIGVKYHIQTNFPSNRIELHHFKDGYCGISKIEDERFSLCYLSTASNLRSCNNSISEMEETILKKNRFLKQILENSNQLFKAPITASNIQFGQRKLVDNQMIYIGDAASGISPLTGNGMSMAAYASFLLANLSDLYLKEFISYEELQQRYVSGWNDRFSKRINSGKYLQTLFANRHLGDLALRAISPFSCIKSRIIASTHGTPFQHP